MDIIIGWQSCEVEFNGKKITMEIRPLKTEAMILLAPYLSGDDLTNTESQATKSMELQKVGKHIFPDHVKNLVGLTINGQPMSWDTLSEEAVLCPLAVLILGELALVSKLTTGDEKNSEGLSAEQKSEELISI